MKGVVRTGAVLASAGALLLAGPGAAFAHECFVANRSAQGAEGAAKSGNWASVPRAELLSELPYILADFGATPEQVDCAVDYAEGVLPEVIAIGVGPAKGTDYVIAANMNDKNKGNGKGVDHLDAILMSVVGECGITLPAGP